MGMTLFLYRLPTVSMAMPGDMALLSFSCTRCAGIPLGMVHMGHTGMTVAAFMRRCLSMVITMMGMAGHFLMTMGMPRFGNPRMASTRTMCVMGFMPGGTGMSAFMPIRAMSYSTHPDPVGRAIAGKITAAAFGRGAEVRHRITPALGAALMHPALDFAHPVTVVHGLRLVVVLFVIVGGSQINYAIRVGMINHCEAVSRKGEKPYDNG